MEVGKLFIGGISWGTNEDRLRQYFETFGEVVEAVIMKDRTTGRARGFGFVVYADPAIAEKVVMKEHIIDGRTIQVLQRTFHELNRKMVEVKRAVPKESSLGPSRNQLGGYNFGLDRVNSFLTGHMQGCNTNSVRGYGVRMEGRSSPGTIGQSGFSPSNHGYGFGLNLESNLSPSSGWNSNLCSKLCYGRGLNTSFSGNSDRFASRFWYGVGSGVNSSVLNSAGQNIWGNGSLSYATNSTNSSPIVGSRSGKTCVSSFSSMGSLWDSSPKSGPSGGAALLLLLTTFLGMAVEI
ncbi:heterogeneous nuclear ribonucleoprotein 1-like [Hibiscus syriacus]|uniref:heterogeneous nuclear ribonucleoprotein 1-like n=1 Tax=Hibiscus syriacus TaxID=106335 RepID=UPI00192429A2|nr:heterogeneous nuclear ribonucleoprotein 1-like [Hibiscus syriacus]